MVRRELASHRRSGAVVGVVPTMGALHEGHLSLVRRARRDADVVVLTLFVNPLQFGPGEDLDRYPRDEERDLHLAEREQVDLVFAPDEAEMYPAGTSTTVTVGPLAETLEGAARPGHFDGVCTVVAKLFNIVEPDVAVFGQKDAQQVAVVRRMSTDLSYATTIVAGETVRHPDGLALSSRNAYLSADERERAGALYAALSAGRDSLTSGAGPDAAREVMRRALDDARVEVDYAEVVDPSSFGPPIHGGDALLVVAAYVGRTRLIDNLLVQPAQ